jgi:hypothetical protein
MNCPRYQFFARSGFAHDQDSGIRWGNSGNLLAHRFDSGAASEDGVGSEKAANRRF